MTTLPCMRCTRLVEVEISGDGQTIEYDYEEIEIDTADTGMVACICQDCMTDAEVIHKARQSASDYLDKSEEMVTAMNMVAERIPKFRDDAEFQARLTWANEQVKVAKAALDNLLAINPENEE